MTLLNFYECDRTICNDFQSATTREWLVTNGIGGYGCGTISGVLTRSYHGLLIASLEPPVARTLLLTKLDETIKYQDQTYELATNIWGDSNGTIAPQGYLHIKSFSVAGTTPVWEYEFADAILSKKIWMKQGENTAYIRYRYQEGSEPLTLSLKALVNCRSHHHVTIDQLDYLITHHSDNGLKIQSNINSPCLYLSGVTTPANKNKNQFNWTIANIWYLDYALPVETDRGLNDRENHLLAGVGEITLNVGDESAIIAKDRPITDYTITENSQPEPNNKSSGEIPPWLQHLICRSEQFIVNRNLANNQQGKTIIAGYPWFTDWGRDTMIALTGLTISTGRYAIAKEILLTFAKYIDGGMLPNVFPDGNNTPEYNTIDATLWYFEAIRQYYQATKDKDFLTQIYPVLQDIIDWHIKGTRHNIKLDDDGLIYGGESGVQLTWMDAKAGDWVVTPRIGKPIEINALWYNAVIFMITHGQIIGQSTKQYQQLGKLTQSSFSKFWYPEGEYCYDVIDSPLLKDGNDRSFRPNQIFAVALPQHIEASQTLLSKSQQKSIVDGVTNRLVTPYGLRSLAHDDPDYIGIYQGDRISRDASYHQGTVWSWLIGYFVQAHLAVYQNPELARSFLLPMVDHLQDGCVGSISEIFDGDRPFKYRGCFSQAWSVGEMIRSWLLCHRFTSNKSN